MQMGGGAGSLSVALAVLVMMVGTGHYLMRNMSDSAGNSSAASSAWCDGKMIDGKCMLIADASGGGEQFEYLDQLDEMDMMVEPESIRSRGLASGHIPPKPFSFAVFQPDVAVVDGGNEYGRLPKNNNRHCPVHKRDC